MLYQKEIDDSVLIQFIILYTLSKVDDAVPYNELLNLVLDNCNINYNDFQVALDNLAKTNHINAFLEGAHNQKYSITQKGMNAGDFFTSNIPIYIREPIDASIKELFKEQRRKNAIQSNISPVRKDEYSADCLLLDDDNTQLMNLSLYAGSRDEAERMARFFREHSDIIYEKILTAFNESKQ
ncbi:MAG: DUF4364 family protein [Clostridia bacterium]|jgi:hypothetical protein|nr:DUF4364 family protein [Clostridia bacterium]MCI8980566.1 DUF4364 family protein [Clostridia bacterium]MCI9084863.1 DUF4364 family protein [Clostridia bacterium]